VTSLLRRRVGTCRQAFCCIASWTGGARTCAAMPPALFHGAGGGIARRGLDNHSKHSAERSPRSPSRLPSVGGAAAGCLAVALGTAELLT